MNDVKNNDENDKNDAKIDENEQQNEEKYESDYEEWDDFTTFLCKADLNRNSNRENRVKESKFDDCNEKQATLSSDIQMTTNNQTKNNSIVCSDQNFS